MGLIETFNKQGGFKLIRNYYTNGVLGTGVAEFLLLGKSKTALEILRLAIQLKIKQKLIKRYQSKLLEFHYNSNIEQKTSNTIWFCWFQGIENAPNIVKACFNSLKKNLPSKNIVVLNSNNIGDYVTLPNYILEKWNTGVITNTHMTDLLRLELLTNYGGTWIDATVLCTQNEDNIPSYFFNSELFFYQALKPGRDGQSTYMSSWYINAKSHNKILEATKYLCYEYWKENNKLIDYFLLHNFMSIAIDTFQEEDKMIPRDNATPHELLLRLFDKYDDYTWKSIINQSPFHKLSYKFDDVNCYLSNTNYKKIISSYI
ncbi:capsular biosynthesis protein [Limosilactobacillus reuteri]|uniref:Capsular biosynthesis protein n=1 Tax=Limosilactobacillus reuteri TaxID=1598 RepID=A0A1Y2UNF2_LIMRT|nr:capsular polysaccharide synthesis protein [Limosilactobacillus reuteri]OTA84671.1 capsular biosynthesis protein [Limosilactobacillus reuteri]